MAGTPTGRIPSTTQLSSHRGYIGRASRTLVPATEETGVTIFENAQRGKSYWIRADCPTNDCWTNNVLVIPKYGPGGNGEIIPAGNTHTGRTVGLLLVQMPGENGFRKVGSNTVLFKANEDGDIIGLFPDWDFSWSDNEGAVPVVVQEVDESIVGINGAVDGTVDIPTSDELEDSVGGVVPASGTYGRTELPLNINEIGIVNKIDYVELVDLYHPYANDLVISLVSPNGTRARLVNRLGSGYGLEGGSVAPGFSGIYSFEETASYEIEPDIPFAAEGTYAPKDSFGVFVGIPVTGAWKLILDDVSLSDTGSIGGWRLKVTHAITDHGLFEAGTASNTVEQTFSDSDIKYFIADPSEGTWPSVLPENPIILTIPVANVGTVASIENVTFLLDREYAGRAHAELESPSGTRVTIFHRPGFVSYPDTGSSYSFAYGTYIFEDTGAELPDNGYISPGTYGRDPGSWPTSGSFSDFKGEQTAGIWRIYFYAWTGFYAAGAVENPAITIRYIPE